jgi:hypothetical protein
MNQKQPHKHPGSDKPCTNPSCDKDPKIPAKQPQDEPKRPQHEPKKEQEQKKPEQQWKK